MAEGGGRNTKSKGSFRRAKKFLPLSLSGGRGMDGGGNGAPQTPVASGLPEEDETGNFFLGPLRGKSPTFWRRDATTSSLLLGKSFQIN